MALINWLGGNACGKVDGLIFQKWKDKTIARSYFKPANPQTEKQQAHRAKFADGTFLASNLYKIFYKGCWKENTPAELYRQLVSEYSKLTFDEDEFLNLYEYVASEGLFPYTKIGNFQFWTFDYNIEKQENQTVLKFKIEAEFNTNEVFNIANFIIYEDYKNKPIFIKTKLPEALYDDNKEVWTMNFDLFIGTFKDADEYLSSVIFQKESDFYYRERFTDLFA